ncbi:MAG TPA: DUF3617 family protein [Sphingomicrobium sp.]|nr:DUF3617 family protein [Sphingomicrobium sp.]
MRLIVYAFAALLAGCGQESAVNNGSEQVPAAINPGEYEVTTVVESLRSTDQTTPATKAKADGKAVTHRACIASDGTVEPAMFSEAGDECRIDSVYARNGRLTLALSCSRPGAPGLVAQSVAGTFSADGFEATVETATYLTGAGDYAMRRKMVGKRVGECARKEDKAG